MKLIKAITDRRSIRAFDSREIRTEDIELLFKAAGHSPSSMNEQPWIYYYSTSNDKSFNKFVNCLLPGNQLWAKEAPLLILTVAKKRFSYNNKPNRHALHDVGAASVSLAIQAAEMGFQAHQMGGFDMGQTLETFNLDIMEFEPVTFIAVGYAGDPETLPIKLRESETAAKEHRDLKQFVNHLKE